MAQQADAASLSPLRTIEIDPELETAEPPVLTAAVLSPSGRLLAAAGDDHVVRIWNVADGTLSAVWKDHTDWVRSVAFDPTEKQLLTGGDDHTIRLWDLASGQVIRVLENPAGIVHRAAYTPDGKRFAVTGFDDRVRLYDAVDGKIVQELTCASDDVRALAMAPNNRSFAAAGRNGTIRTWSLDDYRQQAEIPAHRMRIRVMTYSPDGGRIMTAGDDRKFFVWSESGNREITLANPPGRLMAGVFLDSDRVAVGGSDNVIRIIDAATKRELQRLVGHTGSIAALDYSVDHDLLASSGFDTTVRLWRPAGDKGLKQTTLRPRPETKKS